MSAPTPAVATASEEKKEEGRKRPSSEFNLLIIEALKKKVIADSKKEKEQAYLFDVDWERVGHGKAEGPGSVVVARGLADALLKLHSLGIDKIGDYLDFDEFDELENRCFGEVDSVREESIEEVLDFLFRLVLDDDNGLRPWKLIQFNSVE